MTQMSRKLTLLDGGMGREIKKRISHFDSNLWSASAFDENDNLIVEIHRDFIAAGATVITTNNYALVPSILEKADRMNEFERLTKRSGELAHIARRQNRNIQIAGSLPPLKSTYRPDLILSTDAAQPIYNQIATWLSPFADIFLIESMSSIAEAKAAIAVAETFSQPIWVAFILDDQHPTQLLSGDPVKNITTELQAFSLDAILFNCCHASSITPALKMLNFDGKTGGYANAFNALPKHWHHGDPRGTDKNILPENYTRHATDWVHAGASIVGGCCEIGPDYIQHLATAFRNDLIL